MMKKGVQDSERPVMKKGVQEVQDWEYPVMKKGGSRFGTPGNEKRGSRSGTPGLARFYKGRVLCKIICDVD